MERDSTEKLLIPIMILIFIAILPTLLLIDIYKIIRWYPYSDFKDKAYFESFCNEQNYCNTCVKCKKRIKHEKDVSMFRKDFLDRLK